MTEKEIGKVAQVKQKELILPKFVFTIIKYIKSLALFISGMYIIEIGFYAFPWVTSLVDESLTNKPWLESGLGFGKEIMIPIVEFSVSLIPLWTLLFILTIAVLFILKAINIVKINHI